MNPPVLMPPIEGKQLFLYILAMQASLGDLLAQEKIEGKEITIYYISRTLVGYEINYTLVERACLAVVFASQKLCHYMLTYPIKLVTKIDPLKYFLNKEYLTRRLEKWVLILNVFDIQYVDRKAIKGQVIVDQLAKAPLSNNHSLYSKFLDISILTITEYTWKLYFGGSYTQHGSGAGILFVTPQGDTIPKSYRLLFPCINNMAEYKLLVIGVKMEIEWKITKLNVYGDSQLVINQVNDKYQTKDEKLMPYKCMVEDFKKYFVSIHFEQVPRLENKVADTMETIASLLEILRNQAHYEFLVEQLSNPIYEDLECCIIFYLVRHDSPLYDDIYTYLKDNTLPHNLSNNKKRTFIHKVYHYTIITNTLY